MKFLQNLKFIALVTAMFTLADCAHHLSSQNSALQNSDINDEGLGPLKFGMTQEEIKAKICPMLTEEIGSRNESEFGFVCENMTSVDGKPRRVKLSFDKQNHLSVIGVDWLPTNWNQLSRMGQADAMIHSFQQMLAYVQKSWDNNSLCKRLLFGERDLCKDETLDDIQSDNYMIHLILTRFDRLTLYLPKRPEQKEGVSTFIKMNTYESDRKRILLIHAR